MRSFIKIVLVLLIADSLAAQNITRENYYDHFSKGSGLKGKKLTTAWVDELEVAKILKEEMEKAKFEWVSNYVIIKLNEGQYISSICFSEKSKVGFLYEGSHNMFPSAKTRNVKSMYKEMTGNDFAEKIISLERDADFVKIAEVPSNLFILKEDPYWYQYTDNPEDNKMLVTKEITYAILRADIRDVLAKMKK